MMLKPDEEKKQKLKEIDRQLPWYLRRGWSIFFGIIFPPLLYIFIYLNLKKLDKETLEDRLIWATLILSVWFLKLLPKNNVFSIILIFIAFAFSALLIVIKFSGGHLKDKK
ncbi:hypothetical protein SFC57_10665 [Niallia circulans]|uniref:hypothetical protein n=1 Tax=Niallia circulans TaxID=1397 RepID=UPI00398214F9